MRELDDYDYHEGRGKMFHGGYERPSKRAQAIIDLVKIARRREARA